MRNHEVERIIGRFSPSEMEMFLQIGGVIPPRLRSRFILPGKSVQQMIDEIGEEKLPVIVKKQPCNPIREEPTDGGPITRISTRRRLRVLKGRIEPLRGEPAIEAAGDAEPPRSRKTA
jgi:hypothetical protein